MAQCPLESAHANETYRVRSECGRYPAKCLAGTRPLRSLNPGRTRDAIPLAGAAKVEPVRYASCHWPRMSKGRRRGKRSYRSTRLAASVPSTQLAANAAGDARWPSGESLRRARSSRSHFRRIVPVHPALANTRLATRPAPPRAFVCNNKAPKQSSWDATARARPASRSGSRPTAGVGSHRWPALTSSIRDDAHRIRDIPCKHFDEHLRRWS